MSVVPARSSSSGAAQRAWAAARVGLDGGRTPLWLLLAGPLAGLVVALGIVRPALGLGMVALAAGALIAGRILARPALGFLIALCVYPVYPLTRGLIQLARLPVPLEPLGMWPELVVSVMMTSLVALAARRRERLALGWDDAPVIVLLVGGLYGLLLSLAQRQFVSVVYGVHYSLAALFFYFAARWSRPSAADLRNVLRVLVLTYVIVALISLADYVLRTQTGIRLAVIMRPTVGREWDPQYFWKIYPRMHSLLFDENTWGSLSALVALVSLVRLGVERRPAWWGWGVFGLATGCVGLSMSRGALACFLAGTFVVLLFAPRRNRALVACLILCGAAGSVIAALQSDSRVSALLGRALSLTDQNSRVAYDRVDQWKQSIETFKLVPSGTGLGTAGHAAAFHGGGAGMGLIADGYYFRVAVEQGVPGLLALALGLAGVAWVLVRHLWPLLGSLGRAAPGSAPETEAVVGLTALAYLCGLCAQNVGSNALDYFYVVPVLWTLAGLFVARRFAFGSSVEAVNDKNTKPPSEDVDRTLEMFSPVCAGDFVPLLPAVSTAGQKAAPKAKRAMTEPGRD